MTGLMKSPGNLFLAMMLAVSGCSSSAPKKTDNPSNNGQNGALGDLLQCTKSQCPPGRPTLYVNNTPSPRLSVDMNAPVNWQVTARSSMYPGRTYAALRLDFNPALPTLQVRQSTGMVNGGESITVTGNLNAAALQSNPTATVVVRDMTACQMMAGGTPQNSANSPCNNAMQPTQYDTTLTAPVTLTNNAYSPYSPYSSVPNGSTINNNFNNNGPDLGTRLGMGAGLGALQALFSNNNSSLTGVLGGAVNGAMVSLNQNPYGGGTSNLYSGNAYYNPNGYGYNNMNNYNSGYQTNPGYNSGTYNPQYNYIRGY
jgi:hypothetical protein